MEDKIPGWSEEDYRGMAEYLSYNYTYNPEQYYIAMFINLFRHQFEFGSTTEYFGHIQLNISLVLRAPLGCALLFINDDSKVVRGLAAWRLENGR